ncbi:hypothetical protein HYU17_00360 [Candidatus Woesearchaeota archaeon]|nr:hypothetical protein [Candidatus Woesearchaeota archaeon]
MAKKHLKRLASPATWPLERKAGRFVAKPKGSFRKGMGMSLITLLKDVLRLVETRKEGKRVLSTNEVLVNSERRKDEKLMVGLMDVVSIKSIGKAYRLLLDSNSMLRPVPVTGREALLKPCKVVGKRLVKKGIVQLSLYDGRACLGTNAHKTGDTVVLELPGSKIASHLKLESGCFAYLTGGSNVGLSGVVEHISGDKAVVKIGERTVEAAKRFVFVVGTDKPVISVSTAQ